MGTLPGFRDDKCQFLLFLPPPRRKAISASHDADCGLRLTWDAADDENITFLDLTKLEETKVLLDFIHEKTALSRVPPAALHFSPFISTLLFGCHLTS